MQAAEARRYDVPAYGERASSSWRIRTSHEFWASIRSRWCARRMPVASWSVRPRRTARRQNLVVRRCIRGLLQRHELWEVDYAFMPLPGTSAGARSRTTTSGARPQSAPSATSTATLSRSPTTSLAPKPSQPPDRNSPWSVTSTRASSTCTVPTASPGKDDPAPPDAVVGGLELPVITEPTIDPHYSQHN
jgi:hypothetical protein